MSLGGRTIRLVTLALSCAALSLAPAVASASGCPPLPAAGPGETTDSPPAHADWAMVVISAGPAGATVERFRAEAHFDQATRSKVFGFAIGGAQPHLFYVAPLNPNAHDIAVKVGSVNVQRRVQLEQRDRFSWHAGDSQRRVLPPCGRLAYLTFVPGARLTGLTTQLGTSSGASEITTFTGRGGGAIRLANSTNRGVGIAGVTAGSYKIPFTAQRGVIAGLQDNAHMVKGRWRSPSGAFYEIAKADPRYGGPRYLTGPAGQWVLSATTNTLGNGPLPNRGLMGAWVDVGPLRSVLGFFEAR